MNAQSIESAPVLRTDADDFLATFKGTIIEPPRNWETVNFREIWDYRYMIYFLVLRNLKASYQQSVLGPLWIIINNIVSVAAYSVVFGVIAELPSEGIPYPLFTFS